jgi:hypothetical protein
VTATAEALDAGETVPQAAPLQPVPESDQLTPLFCVSFVTVAVKVFGWLTGMLAVSGATNTETGAVTVMVETEVFVPSAMEVALSVTVAGAGTLAGAA